MTITHGFQLLREQDIKEINTKANLFRHTKTGAELLSLSNNDENKVFGITFRTPPSDSTGVAHILEHSVLCGSRKYPVKEPFVELLKGSLSTFLNAFTYPDKTCYPVASQNLQDFHNLIHVYLDAVFYPRITPFIFQQEGWHFELEQKDRPLLYKGVVFNEMKGAYSSPDNLLAEYSLQSLFPDNTYGFDSGGDPKKIPDLSYEQFRVFHQKYYHPSNSRIYFYGDDDPEERLRIINEYLKVFEPIELDSTIRHQPAFDRPVRLTRPFMVGEENQAEAKGMITLNWLLPLTTDIQANISLRLLSYILLGMPGSPLRKALIDSRLGEDITGEGLGAELNRIYFSTGLKGIEIENAERIESLILETLETQVRKGIDPLNVEAALNMMEFRLRENNTGSLPRGLVLMLRALTTWLYDGDPVALLAFETPLNEIKSLVKSKSSFFEDIIDRLLLTNQHRTTLLLIPDPDLRKKEEAAEKERLAAARSAMSPQQLDEIIENTVELKRLQETPDSPEALKTIPVLKLSDLERKNRSIPLISEKIKGTPVLFHDLFTNGIVYLDLGFNLHTLPERYLSYIPLFGRALLEIGTENEDFVAFTQRISRKTGGITSQTSNSTVANSTRSASWLFLHGKAISGRAGDLFSILKDSLLTVKLDNRERFRQMVLEEKARQEQKLIPEGHQAVNLRLRSHFGEAFWAAEQMSGISYLFFLRELARDIENKWPEVLSILEEIRCTIVNSKAAIMNITLDKGNWPRVKPLINDFLDALPQGPVSECDWSRNSSALCEGMTIPAQVNYVGKGTNIYESGYQFHGSALVITRYLRNSWLWDQVRVLGGAYGVFCMLGRLSGVLTFVSYRDPNLVNTIDAFDNAAGFLRDLDLGKEELTKSIIGAIGDLDTFMLPDVKGYTSMLRYLSGDTDEDRQKMRDEILETGQNDFTAFAKVLEKVKEKGLVKLLGAESAIKKVAGKRPGWLEIIKVL